jgi:hypothetical protein
VLDFLKTIRRLLSGVHDFKFDRRFNGGGGVNLSLNLNFNRSALGLSREKSQFQVENQTGGGLVPQQPSKNDTHAACRRFLLPFRTERQFHRLYKNQDSLNKNQVCENFKGERPLRIGGEPNGKRTRRREAERRAAAQSVIYGGAGRHTSEPIESHEF